jgi:hypothetical protein
MALLSIFLHDIALAITQSDTNEFSIFIHILIWLLGKEIFHTRNDDALPIIVERLGELDFENIAAVTMHNLPVNLIECKLFPVVYILKGFK